MKKIISLVLVCVIMMALGIAAFAEEAERPAWNIALSDKTPIDTPNFKPVIDGQKDAGYTATYTADKQNDASKAAHPGGSKVSTAWYENTLYFYIEVPDTTPQESIDGLNNYQRDGVWFMLFFRDGIDSDDFDTCRWPRYKQSKYFKVYPKLEALNFEGPCFEQADEPPVEDDFEYKVVYGDSGYVIEIAYTVPTATAALAAGKEIAFDFEVYDCNDPSGTHRYYLATGEEAHTENVATALGAKLVLAEAAQEPVVDPDPTPIVNPGTADYLAVAVLTACVALAGTALVIKKERG